MSKNEMISKETPSGFLALADFDLSGALAEELNGLDGGFESIKIPAGGSTMFEVPGEEPGDTDAVKEFAAVILYHHPLLMYYRDKYVGGNNPPDCSSFDGITGEGNPGGNCACCPLNQFGTSESGGKACKSRRRIYVLREGEILPMLLSLPTGSLKEFSRYVKRLLSKGKKSNTVVTRFALQKATNASGIVYSQAHFTVDRPLTEQEYALIAPLAEQVKAHSRAISYEVDTPQEQIDPETGEIIQPLA